MRHVRSLPLFALAILATAAGARAERPGAERTLTDLTPPPVAGGLTSEQVAERALSSSLDVRAKREAVAAAGARVDQAIIAYVPRVALTGRYTRLSSIEMPSLGSGSFVATPLPPGSINPTPTAAVAFAFPVFLNQYYFQANVGVPFSDYVLRTSQQLAAASHGEKAARLDEHAARLKAVLDGRVSYYTWVRARAQHSVASQGLAQARGHLDDVRHAFEVGTASKADALRVESQVAGAELLVARAEDFALVAEEALRVAMHDEVRRSYDVGEDLRSSLPPVEGARSLDALIARAFDKRLEVRALDETVWSLREQTKAIKATQLPRIDGFADAYYANPHPRFFPQSDEYKFTWDVGVQVTWTPNDVFSAGAQGAEMAARAAQTEAQKMGLRDGVRLEVTQANQAVREADVAAETSVREHAAAEESYRVRRELFKNGRATSSELTDAESELLRAELEVVNARIDQRVSRLRLEHAVGDDVATK